MYLTGASNMAVRKVARSVGLGVMLQPGYDYWDHVPDYTAYACDNGCFAQGERFDLGAYLRWLETNRRIDVPCLFAVAPDVFGDAAATWRRSAPVLPQIRDLGYLAALVAQDGLTPETISWGEFDVLFMGGTTAWKLSQAASRLVRAAKRRGLHVHAGRVNSLRRLVAMQLMGCDSADGTYLRFGPDANLPTLLDWLAQLHKQPCLPLEV